MPVSGYIPSYKSYSQYKVTPVVGNFLFYYIHRPIDPQEDDIEVNMDSQIYVARPDRLANDLYGKPDLWWVFGVRNGWEDPVYDLKLGITMMVPQYHYLRDIL